jgi:isopenicillin N synthase-like dioxygenase
MEAVMSERIVGDSTPNRDRVADAEAEIPIIDISNFCGGEKERRLVVDAACDACERIGFLLITGHDAPEETACGFF